MKFYLPTYLSFSRQAMSHYLKHYYNTKENIMFEKTLNIGNT